MDATTSLPAAGNVRLRRTGTVRQRGKRAAGRLLLAALFLPLPAVADQAVRLFEVTGPRDTFTLGVPAATLDGMGPGPDVTRLARALTRDGQVTGWRYTVGRGVNGLLLRAAGPVALLRSDAIRLEPYVATLPVLPLPDAEASR